MQIKKLVMPFIVCGGLLTTFISSADVTITQKGGDKIFISKSMIKSQSLLEEGVNFIASMETGELLSIDHNNKEYITTTADASCQMQKQLSALIPDFRRKQDKPKVTIKADKNKVDIAGYSTIKYKVFVDEELKEIIWLSSDQKLVKAVKNAELFFDKMTCMGNFHYTASEAYQNLLKKGFQLKSYSNLPGISENEIEDVISNQSNNDMDETDGIEVHEVTKIDYSNIPTSEFEIPTGYKKISIAQAQQRQMEQMRDNSDMQDRDEEMQDEGMEQQEVIDELKKLTEDSELGGFLLKALDKVIE